MQTRYVIERGGGHQIGIPYPTHIRIGIVIRQDRIGKTRDGRRCDCRTILAGIWRVGGGVGGGGHRARALPVDVVARTSLGCLAVTPIVAAHVKRITSRIVVCPDGGTVRRRITQCVADKGVIRNCRATCRTAEDNHALLVACAGHVYRIVLEQITRDFRRSRAVDHRRIAGRPNLVVFERIVLDQGACRTGGEANYAVSTAVVVVEQAVFNADA